MKELIKIQQGLKVPKNRKNSFGNYTYRSAEDILEAVKPLLTKNDCFLILKDEIVEISNRFYIKATVEISNGEHSISTCAFAREPQEKKGMDEAQITGSTSSYARKYALSGLFAIDDEKDPDTNEHKKQGENAKVEKQGENAIEKQGENAKVENKPVNQWIDKKILESEGFNNFLYNQKIENRSIKQVLLDVRKKYAISTANANAIETIYSKI